MTPRMFVAALVQHASSSHSLTTNLRFRWEYQPGSELFVVYTDGHDTLGHAQASVVAAEPWRGREVQQAGSVLIEPDGNLQPSPRGE